MWRLIEYQEFTASMNMAIDEVISDSVKNGGLPTIRFYGWNPPAVSIGYFQCIQDEVDLIKCQLNELDVVRRRTGGGAVYHDKEITYSIICKEELFSKDIIQSYKEICNYVIQSLDLLGIKSSFKPINDIIVNGKKISGNAQTRREGVITQHGTILYQVDVNKMFSVLKVVDEKIRDKQIQNVKERVTSVRLQKDISFEDFYHALIQGFCAGKNISFVPLTEEELLESSKLAFSKYGSNEWNFWR